MERGKTKILLPLTLPRQAADWKDGRASARASDNDEIFASLLETEYVEADDTENREEAVNRQAEENVMKDIETHKAHEELMRRKDVENERLTKEGKVECLSWSEDDCEKKASLACTWNVTLHKCLKSCTPLTQNQCHDRSICHWDEGQGSCDTNPHAHLELGGTMLHKHQAELDEESGDGCLPFLRDDSKRHEANSVEETLFWRLHRMKKKNPKYARCGLAEWKFEADVEVASQMLACRIWRTFFEWIYIQLERTAGFSADWRDANSTFQYFSWFSKVAQPHASFYDRIWMLNKDGFDTARTGPETFMFGNSERSAALYEEHVAEMTTRPIYFHIMDVFTSVAGDDLTPVLPYYGSYGWYHLGRTRNTRMITKMVDDIIMSIGRVVPLHRDSERDLLVVENLRAIFAEKKLIQELCPRLYLDPRQYSHTSFSALRQDPETEPRVWNTREEPLACSLTQVLLRLRSWKEVTRGFTLVDPSSDAKPDPEPIHEEPSEGTRWWWLWILLALVTVLFGGIVAAILLRNRI